MPGRQKEFGQCPPGVTWLSGSSSRDRISLAGRHGTGQGFRGGRARGPRSLVGRAVHGDPAVVDKVLAEEFQILRSNGGGHDKAGYLKALPKQTTRSKFSDIIATGTARHS
jgi:hypothetical protein